MNDENKIESDSTKLSLITLPPSPSFDNITDHINDDEYAWLFSLTSQSLPLSAIASRLNPFNRQNQFLYDSARNKTAVLLGIFELLNSPIEKFNLVQLLLPYRSRYFLLSKPQVIKHLLRYTETEHVKSGFIREMIDSIPIGKSSESVKPEFISSIISALQNFWDECKLLKNSNFKRIQNVAELNNNQITLNNISKSLDNLQQQRLESTSIDHLYPYVEVIFDKFFVLNNSNENGLFAIELVLSCVLNRSLISENIVFNALCMNPKGLATAIWNSRMNLWNVIYGIEYLKNKNVYLWKELLGLTKFETNKRMRKSTSLIKNNGPKFLVNIIVGVPFSPMRCGKTLDHYDVIVDKVSIFKDNVRQETEGFCIEEKLDGERSVFHLWRDPNNKDKILTKFYSRAGIIQPWYGYYVGDPNGIMTKYLKPEYFDGVDNLILDGEMITFDENKGMLLGFQDVKICGEMLKKKLKEGDDLTKETIYNRLLIYDILHLNGQNLLTVNLKERKNKLLRSLSKFDFENCKFFQIHKWNIGYSSDDIKIAMTNVVEKFSEGLVVKHWESKYYVGSTSKQWYKLKPHYVRDIVSELDVTIIGKEAGNLLCALYGDSQNDKYRDWFISFCLLRFGLDTKTKEAIEEKTSGHWIPYKRYESDIEMQEHRVKFGTLKPNYWIHPQNSVVITVKAKSLFYQNDDSPNKFLLNTTLRHPYCIGVRHDKTYLECDTISDYESLLERHNQRGLFDSYDEKDRSPTKRRRMETKKDLALNEINKNFITTIVKSDELFQGITFCVKTDCSVNDEEMPISEINGILESHGGKLTTNPSHYFGDKLMVIADKYTQVVVQLKSKYNIFKFKWCEDSIRCGHLVSLDPTHCLAVDDEVKKISEKNIDKFGCNYTLKYNKDMLWNNSKLFSNEDEKRSDKLNEEQCFQLQLPFYQKKMVLIGYEESMAFQKELVETYTEILGGSVVVDILDADYAVVATPTLESLTKRKNPFVEVVSGDSIIEMCKEKENTAR
jgi:DNA ligase-4